MINPVVYIARGVQQYILRDHVISNDLDFQKGQTLVRFHNHKTDCDVSFSALSVVWENYFGCNLNGIFPKNDEEFQNFMKNFLAVAKNWRFPIERIERLDVSCARLALFFQRTSTISELLRLVLNGKAKNRLDVYGNVPKNPIKRIHNLATKNDENNLTYYRAAMIRRTLERVLAYSEWNIVDQSRKEDDGVLQVEVISVAAMNRENETLSTGSKVIICCGVVVDPKTGKLVSEDTAEYIKSRTNDLNLMALHKYGIRAKDDVLYGELMDSLGVAAVTVDLVEKKCSSPATIIRNGQGSNTKGACFILYNSARLETLLKTFDTRVSGGQYQPLPPIEKIDFGLLNNEEEWQLIFGYVFTFPDLIERSIRQLENGQFSSHFIVQYLSGLVGTFSVYYRRIRILTEYRAQLMDTLYARIYLLKALQDVLNKALGLLNIQPVSHM